MNSKVLVPTLLAIVLLEGLVIGYLTVVPLVESTSPASYNPSNLTLETTVLANYRQFNAPITNDTEAGLNHSYKGSWLLTVQNNLLYSARNAVSTEAEIAIAPEGQNETLSIPTIIVQERADGLLRIEYFEQNWPHTFGLVLYNSTPGNIYQSGAAPAGNLSIEFVRFAQPSEINPQVAPRPDGNLTVFMGRRVLVSAYPIAWASLDSLYIYGLPGSSFDSGNVTITVAQLNQV